jgi:hypothetical protein
MGGEQMLLKIEIRFIFPIRSELHEPLKISHGTPGLGGKEFEYRKPTYCPATEFLPHREHFLLSL